MEAQSGDFGSRVCGRTPIHDMINYSGKLDSENRVRKLKITDNQVGTKAT